MQLHQGHRGPWNRAKGFPPLVSLPRASTRAVRRPTPPPQRLKHESPSVVPVRKSYYLDNKCIKKRGVMFVLAMMHLKDPISARDGH